MPTFAEVKKLYPGWSDEDILADIARANGVDINYVRGYLNYEEPSFSQEASNAFRRSLGQSVQGIGQIAEDIGWDDNFIKRYGQSVVERNPTRINSISDVLEHPTAALGSAIGNAAGFMAPAGALGVAGKLAGLGGRAMFTAQSANAAIPSYGGIREQQQQDGNNSINDVLTAAGGATAVGLIENLFGLQRQPWARSLLGLEQQTGKQLTREAIKDLAVTARRSALKEWALGGLGEGFEEILQNPIEQAAAYQDPTTEAALKDTAFSGLMGTLGGLGLGGIGGYQAYRQHKGLAQELAPYSQQYSERPVDLLQALEVKEKYDIGAPFMEEAAYINQLRDDPELALEEAGGVIGERDYLDTINQAVGVHDFSSKQHKQQQREYNKLFNSGSGVFAIAPDTQQERELSLYEWLEVQNNLLPPVVKTEQFNPETGQPIPMPTNPGEAVGVIEAARVAQKNGQAIEVGSDLHKAVLQANEILNEHGLKYDPLAYSDTTEETTTKKSLSKREQAMRQMLQDIEANARGKDQDDTNKTIKLAKQFFKHKKWGLLERLHGEVMAAVNESPYILPPSPEERLQNQVASAEQTPPVEAQATMPEPGSEEFEQMLNAIANSIINGNYNDLTPTQHKYAVPMSEGVPKANIAKNLGTSRQTVNWASGAIKKRLIEGVAKRFNVSEEQAEDAIRKHRATQQRVEAADEQDPRGLSPDKQAPVLPVQELFSEDGSDRYDSSFSIVNSAGQTTEDPYGSVTGNSENKPGTKILAEHGALGPRGFVNVASDENEEVNNNLLTDAQKARAELYDSIEALENATGNDAAKYRLAISDYQDFKPDGYPDFDTLPYDDRADYFDWWLRHEEDFLLLNNKELAEFFGGYFENTDLQTIFESSSQAQGSTEQTGVTASNRVSQTVSEVENADSARFSKTDATGGTTKDRIYSALSDWFFSKNKLKRHVKIVQSWDDLPAYVRNDPRLQKSTVDPIYTQGFYLDGKVYLIADNIQPGEERSVFMHEAGVHLGLTDEEESILAAKVREWANAKEGSLERRIHDRVMRRMESAKEKSDGELVAYATEEAVSAGVKPTLVTMVGRWLKRLSDFIMAKLRAEFETTKPLTPLDLVDYTYGAAHIALELKESRRNAVKFRAVDPTSENFKRWSNNAPLVTRDEAETYDFKTGKKVVVEAFHGTGRPDRVGVIFKRSRATSGPMAFFTSNPTLASNYSESKQDTSLSYEDQSYATWFKVKFPGDRSTTDIVQAWYRLDKDTKAKIREMAPKLRLDDTGEHVTVDDDNTSGNGSYDYNLQESARRDYMRQGNPLEALVEDWLNSGVLLRNEMLFMDVLHKAGFPMNLVTYDSPQDTFPFVYRTYIQMQNPLVTWDIPASTMAALEDMAKRDRSQAKQYGADFWDKNTRTPREWFALLQSDGGKHAWTSIPDKVTKVLADLGYDGIIDYSGKGGGHSSPVYIPFYESQVKSAISNTGKFDGGKKNIHFSNAEVQFSKALRSPATAVTNSATSFMDTLADIFANAKGFIKESGLGWLTLEQLADTVKSKTVSEYHSVMVKMQQMSKDLIYQASLIDQDWATLVDKNPSANKRMMEVMREATRAETDPDKGEGTSELISKFNALPEEAKQLYRRVRDYYESTFELRKQIMLDAANQTQMAGRSTTEVNRLFAKIKGPYFPLMRLGRWYAVGMSNEVKALYDKLQDGTITSAEKARYDKLRKDPQHYKASGFNSRAEAKRAAEQMRAELGNGFFNVSEERIASELASMPDIAKVEAYLTANMPAETQAQIKSLMAHMVFDMLPEHHALKRQMKREGIHGEEEDMRRVFAQSALSQAHYISRLKYANDLSAALMAVKKEGHGNNETMRMVANELTKRTKLAMDIDDHPMVDRLLQGSYFAHLGMSPAFVFTNMTQVPMITAPWLGARHGFGVATRALADAYRDVFKMMKSTYTKDGLLSELNWKDHLNADEAKAFQTLLDRNLLDITIEHDLGSVADMQNTKLDKYIKLVNSPVRITELANRAITGLAAYRLAKAKGMSEDAAIEHAAKAVSSTQLDYSSLNTPRHMQTVLGSKAIAKLMFQFRKYQQGMVYLVVKNFHDAFINKSATKEERDLAKRTLLGLFTTTGMMAGALGMPAFGSALWLASVIGSAFGDDDEPFDAEVAFRNWLTDLFGKDAALVLAKGLPTLINADLSKRVGLGDVLTPLPFLRQGKTGTDAVNNTLVAAAGPAFSTIATTLDGVYELGKGHYAKAAEKIIPVKAAQNLIRVYRYETEGLTNRNGEIVIPDEKFSVWDLALRGAGFQPTKESEYYAANQAVEGRKQAVMDTRSRLLREYAQAVMKGEATDDINEKIAKFNERNPQQGVRIDYSAKHKAVQARKKMAAERDETGVRLDKLNKRYAYEGRFAIGQ